MYSQKLAQYCIEKLDLKNVALGVEYYYSSLPLCVIDAVFSIGIRYVSTQNVVKRFCHYLNLEIFRKYQSAFPPMEQQYSLNRFIDFYQNNNLSFITNSVYENKCRTSTNNGILKSQAVIEFAYVLQKYNVNYFQDISLVINNTNFEKDIKNIKGQKSGKSLSYFFMLSGEENLIKPDRMIERFVEDCIGKKLSSFEIIKLFNEVIIILNNEFKNLTLRQLDYEIWKYESSNKKSKIMEIM
jgi:hypothetical protein